jgi:hypothetical protein
MNIYIACGLTHVPRAHFHAYVTFIHQTAEALRLAGANRVTYALVNSDPQLAEKPFEERARLCYLWDRELVHQSDLIVAEASYPSTGMGIELQLAESKGIPVIICFRKSPETRTDAVLYENPDHTRHCLQVGEGYVSLMALGLTSVLRVIGYESEDKGTTAVVEAFRLLNKKSQGEAAGRVKVKEGLSGATI